MKRFTFANQTDVVLGVRDLNQAIAFYRKALDLNVNYLDECVAGMWLPGTHAFLELREGKPRGFATLIVNDVSAAAKSLAATSEIPANRIGHFDGEYYTRAFDVWGNRLRLTNKPDSTRTDDDLEEVAA